MQDTTTGTFPDISFSTLVLKAQLLTGQENKQHIETLNWIAGRMWFIPFITKSFFSNIDKEYENTCQQIIINTIC